MNWESELPLIRKIISIGNSKAVCLPKSWLDYYERELGEEITKVCVEMEGMILTIYPFEAKKKKVS